MRRIAAWALYAIGDGVSRLDFLPLPFPVFRWAIYRPYQFFMAASMRAQGDGPGPWLPCEPDPTRDNTEA